MAGAARTPRKRHIEGQRQYRIIPSRFPLVDLFENLVDSDELETLIAIESLTNDRLMAEVGDIHLVNKDEWVTGAGATVVMAAFTHIGSASRFSDGSYGVYYAALDEETAIAETVFHRTRFLAETAESPIEVDMRCYVGTITAPLEDVRGKAYEHLQNPDLASWPVCQEFGKGRRDAGSVGLLCRSVRRTEEECIGAFRTGAISRPRQGARYRYCWNGSEIHRVIKVSQVIEL